LTLRNTAVTTPVTSIDYLDDHHDDFPGANPVLDAVAIADIMKANTLGARRNLVVCPAARRLRWQMLIRQWSTIKNPRVFKGRVHTPGPNIMVVLRATDGISHAADYVIVSDDLMRNPKVVAAVEASDWNVIMEQRPSRAATKADAFSPKTSAATDTPAAVIAALLDLPSVYLMGPSWRSIKPAEQILTALKAAGFTITAPASVAPVVEPEGAAIMSRRRVS
jgi:hypothetical protein